MTPDGDASGPDDAELLRDGLRSLREEGDADGLLRTARSVLYWAERLGLADPGAFDEELAMFTEPDIKALRCAIRQGEHVLRAPAGDWQTKAVALLAEVDKHPVLAQVAARGRADLAAAGLGGEPRGMNRQWSPESGQSAVTSDFHGHQSAVTACLLLDDGRRLATCDRAEVLVWDTGRRALVAIHRNDDPAEIMRACAPRSGAWLCTLQVDGGQLGQRLGNEAALKLWDLREGGAPRTLVEGRDGPYHCRLSPDEKWLVVRHANGAVDFWNTATWQRSGLISGTAAYYAPDGSWFALADADGKIGLWDPETLTLKRVLAGSGPGIYEMAAPDDASWLAVTGDRELCIWDTREGTLLARADASGVFCSGLIADPEGQWAAACFGTDSLRVIPATARPGPGRAAQRWTPLAGRARRALRRAPDSFQGAVCATGHHGSRILSVSAVQEQDGNVVWTWYVMSCWDTTTGRHVTGPANRPGGLPRMAVPRDWQWAALVGEEQCRDSQSRDRETSRRVQLLTRPGALGDLQRPVGGRGIRVRHCPPVPAGLSRPVGHCQRAGSRRPRGLLRRSARQVGCRVVGMAVATGLRPRPVIWCPQGGAPR